MRCKICNFSDGAPDEYDFYEELGNKILSESGYAVNRGHNAVLFDKKTGDYICKQCFMSSMDCYYEMINLEEDFNAMGDNPMSLDELEKISKKK